MVKIYFPFKDNLTFSKFSGKNKKTISDCHLLKILSSMLNIKHLRDTGSNKSNYFYLDPFCIDVMMLCSVFVFLCI